MTFVKFLLLAPLAALLLAFAFANREWVKVAFDPTGRDLLPPVEAPQYSVLLVAVGLGAIAGGTAMWLRQGRYRRAARAARDESARLRQELRSAHAAPPARRSA